MQVVLAHCTLFSLLAFWINWQYRLPWKVHSRVFLALLTIHIEILKPRSHFHELGRRLLITCFICMASASINGYWIIVNSSLSVFSIVTFFMMCTIVPMASNISHVSLKGLPRNCSMCLVLLYGCPHCLFWYMKPFHS